MVFETNDLVENNKKVIRNKEVFEEVENEAKKKNDCLENVKKNLNLLEIVIENPECPESLKELQSKLLLLFKDYMRRGYY
jgi:hypothetical protein